MNLARQFPKETTMNLENEILGIRTSLGRIECRMDEIGKLSERVSKDRLCRDKDDNIVTS